MDAVVSSASLQTTDDHYSDITAGIHDLILQQANLVNCSRSPVYLASLEAENCNGGSEELPRLGFVEQKDEAFLSDFKSGKSVASPKVCTTTPMAGESSKMGDSEHLFEFSTACLTFKEICKILDYFRDWTVNSMIQEDAKSREALYRDVRHGRGLLAQYLGAKIRAGFGSSIKILKEMEKGGVSLKDLAIMVSQKSSS